MARDVKGEWDGGPCDQASGGRVRGGGGAAHAQALGTPQWAEGNARGSGHAPVVVPESGGGRGGGGCMNTHGGGGLFCFVPGTALRAPGGRWRGRCAQPLPCPRPRGPSAVTGPGGGRWGGGGGHTRPKHMPDRRSTDGRTGAATAGVGETGAGGVGGTARAQRSASAGVRAPRSTAPGSEGVGGGAYRSVASARRS